MALAITVKLEDLERIDRLIVSNSTRRDAAIRELEKRRNILAKRAGDFWEDVVTDAHVDFLETVE